jgi:hypothetical protein
MCNEDIVNVTITPVPGTQITQLGMFDISVTPVNPTDQILNLQYIVSVDDQPQGEFVAFAFIGSFPAGAGLPQSIFYASCDGVNASNDGHLLTVEIAGAVNDVANCFIISKSFSPNLWPGGTCSSGSSRGARLSEGSPTYQK